MLLMAAAGEENSTAATASFARIRLRFRRIAVVFSKQLAPSHLQHSAGSSLCVEDHYIGQKRSANLRFVGLISDFRGSSFLHLHYCTELQT
jgi:hypothetical protein